MHSTMLDVILKQKDFKANVNVVNKYSMDGATVIDLFLLCVYIDSVMVQCQAAIEIIPYIATVSEIWIWSNDEALSKYDILEDLKFLR